jgi:tetratricopeptide (TPR) repeat protein
MIQRATLPLLCVALLAAAPARAADPWHLAGWQARAVVEVAQPLADPGVDTAAARVLCQGRAKPDGSDYRVLDAAGKPVPFQLTFHDAGRYSLIAFRADRPQPHQRFYIYFDNPKAERAKEQVADNPAPGAGPPKGDWVPHAGLVLQTIQRPEGDNPQTVDDMAKLIAASPYRHGARYQRRIADGYNPFGSSDYYISIYRGWVTIPKAGTYQFCTASNEASFSFLDGKPLVHWPGRHTAERGMHGEKNAAVELTAGLHYVEYYHEEVTLEQMAFLGWRPPGEPAFGGIPESVYTAPHEAAVLRYEDPKGPLLHFEPAITDSVWPAERHEGQYTRCRFQVGRTPALPDGTTYRWEFGDGESAAGPDVEHVYLALGKYAVTLTAQGPQGTATARWPLEVYEIEQVTEQFKEGRPKDYAQLARRYDRSKLDAASLKELAYLLAEGDDPAAAVETGKEFVRRFGTAEPQMTARVRRLMADCALRLGKDNVDEAVANYQASITKETPAAEKLDVLARLIRLLGIERNLPDKAGEVLGQAEEAARGARMDEETQAAYRRAVIAGGDVLLWQGKVDGALDLYRRAEALGSFIPSQVRAARVGAYPNAIRDFLEAGNLGAALDVVDRWEETFPTDKPKGQTFFWRGKVYALRGQARDAARCLARSVGLATGAGFEPEARWLLAQSLEQMGRADDARKELAKLVALGGTDAFTKKAREKLQQGAEPGK